MERQITSKEADERFTELLRDVAAGESFVVTEDGRPVARVVPVEGVPDPAQVDKLLAYLRSRPFKVIGPWTRDELYD